MKPRTVPPLALGSRMGVCFIIIRVLIFRGVWRAGGLFLVVIRLREVWRMGWEDW